MIPRLFSWLTDSRLAEAMMGDLLDERRRRAERSRPAAAAWFWMTIGALITHLAFARIRTWASEVTSGATSLMGGRGDLRHAIRSLRRAPWYSAAVIGVIALGIALSSTAFAVVDGVVFKPLPYRDPDRLYVAAGGFLSDGDRPALRFSAASAVDLDVWKRAVPGVTFGTFNASGRPLDLGAAERPRVATVDAAFLGILGISPRVGGFRPADFATPRDIQPALITHALWQRAFGADPSIVGQVITDLEQQRIQVVGILPPAFVFPATSRRLVPDVLTPLVVRAERRTDPRARDRYVIARVPPALAIEAVEQRLAVAAADVAALWPAPPASAGPPPTWRRPFDRVTLLPLRSTLTSSVSDVSWAVFVASALLVLLACVNVTGLAGTRLQDRRHELALRRALGGTTGDLLRSLAIETMLIVTVGAALGVLLASQLLDITMTLMPPGLMFLKPPVLDARVVSFAALAAGVCAAIMTLWPAWSTRQPAESLAGSRTATGRSRTSARAILIAAQVALALVMAIAGTLLTGSLLQVWQEDPGFDPDHSATILLTGGRGASAVTINEMASTVRDLGGVSAAGGMSDALLENMRNGSPFETPPGIAAADTVEGISITAGFFEAAGLHAIEGRLPTDAEMVRGEPVVAVSARVARQYWPAAAAPGQTLRAGGRVFTVVGVVPDARYRALDVEPDGAIYSSIAADARPFVRHLLVRFHADADADASLPRVLDLLAHRFPMYRVSRVQTLTAALGESIRHRRLQTWLFSSFGVAAVVLAGVGILGVMAMTTGRRTREVGIRIAVGATRVEVVGLILREQLATVVAGLLVGGVIASWAVRFVRAYVYELEIYDSRAWLFAGVTILVTATIGAALPAWRASRIDPVKALRVE